ncbi:orotate phosphoribosyltransferase [bacterium]|nr:orotate phosphoribosyltransferase [bacterium]
MNIEERVEELLEETGALKRGHFLLSSGLHSDRYCQCAALFEEPAMAEEVARLMADALPEDLTVDTVLSPAIGGILWGYELARALGARSLFAERKPGELFQLRRGFHLSRGERVLLAEDVVTTGRSVLEVVPLIEAAGAELVGFASIADRSAGKFTPSHPFYSLIKLNFQTWAPADCPHCAAGTAIDKPGSRVEKG